MLKHLVEYENKIEQLQLKIKNQETKEQKLQAKIREMATTIATLEAKLAKDESIADPTEPTSCLPFGNSSDIHTIRLPGTEAFQVPCDSRFAGNGWIVIHRRIDGSDCYGYFQNQTDQMLKDLVEYENQIEQLKLKIKNQGTNAGAGKDESIAYPAEATSCLPFGNSSDIHTIRLPGTEAFQVSCDSRFAGNGWTVIQRRMDGSVSFNRTWNKYKQGFGELDGELWLGLEKLHLITKFQPQELYIQLEDFSGEKRYARYSNFSVGSESQLYELLSLGDFSGNTETALTRNKKTHHAGHLNMKFTTPDRDNDYKDGFNCGKANSSGWWFKKCYSCNLNGLYVHTKTGENQENTINWLAWHHKPLKFVQMMIRPVQK
ncbi:maker420 [Drosophila busckii]|uniref:Maker420 n=1 Tax=Drosophila busckii TaxID=30019 RepID=A0A0M4E8L2_DROBS|nr:maker420 [Drosophila busckii]